jgi:hypothetical protein
MVPQRKSNRMTLLDWEAQKANILSHYPSPRGYRSRIRFSLCSDRLTSPQEMVPELYTMATYTSEYGIRCL